jgi:hypothetical protein
MTEAWAAPDENVTLGRLAAAFPAWELWLVPLWPVGAWWCARLRSDHKLVVRENDPARLAEMLNFVAPCIARNAPAPA